MVTDILSRADSELSQLIVQIFDTAFLSPFGDLGATYSDHPRLVGKRVEDFLFVLIELFSLGRTAEALRTKIDRKSAISPQRGPLTKNFR